MSYQFFQFRGWRQLVSNSTPPGSHLPAFLPGTCWTCWTSWFCWMVSLHMLALCPFICNCAAARLGVWHCGASTGWAPLRTAAWARYPAKCLRSSANPEKKVWIAAAAYCNSMQWVCVHISSTQLIYPQITPITLHFHLSQVDPWLPKILNFNSQSQANQAVRRQIL